MIRALCTAALIAACGGDGSGAGPDAAAAGWQPAPALPAAVANNAVAAGGETCTLYSALGIDDTLTAAGIGRRAYAWTAGDQAWRALPDVPGTTGRIAAAAVVVRGKLYVLGGYSVGVGGAETSFDAVDIYDPATGAWSAGPPMPVPIDDQVAVAWRDRWIVVVSGWSNTGNVDAVQLLDVDTGGWSMATAFPGQAAFGHAGAIDGDTLVVIDGTGDSGGFAITNQAWRGDLDPDDPTTIRWTDLGAHPGPPRYRAAAGGAGGTLWFHGGTDQPYNFDGRAYADGQPSPPLASTLAYDVAADRFELVAPDKPAATMDHRGLIGCGDALYTVGGLVAGPAATDQVWRIDLESLR